MVLAEHTCLLGVKLLNWNTHREWENAVPLESFPSSGNWQSSLFHQDHECFDRLYFVCILFWQGEEEEEDSFVVDNSFVEYETEYVGDTMLAEDPIIYQVRIRIRYTVG